MNRIQTARPADEHLSMRVPNFNGLAGVYRWMELASFGPWLAWCRCAFLASLGSRRHALILGDGDGRFTARLLQINPEIHIDAVDSSSAMLEALIRRAVPHTHRVRTHLDDARTWRLGNLSGDSPEELPFDLIVAHFFLDCLTTEEAQLLASRLCREVSPDAIWLVSEFAIPDSWYGRLVATPVVWGLYRIFGWLTGLAVRDLPDHRSALSSAGFALQKHRTWLGGLLISELWSTSPAESVVGPTTT